MNRPTMPEQGASTTDEMAHQRINELEMRTAFMEDTIEALNQQLADISREFSLAKQAMQLMNKQLEQMQSNESGVKNPADEAPPPHY